jgi:hypothetical protein
MVNLQETKNSEYDTGKYFNNISWKN